ncbi:hypothetical protein TNCV_2696241 [Trichonephila clavipes]|nr:hypothetical protein TNCV_2696241 [Trichonephila clavipes]
MFDGLVAFAMDRWRHDCGARRLYKDSEEDVFLESFKSIVLDVTVIRVCKLTTSEPATKKNCSEDHSSRCRPNVSRPQKGCFVALTWPSSNQCTVINDTKIETSLIGEHNTSPFRSPMSSSLTSLKSKMSVI